MRSFLSYTVHTHPQGLDSFFKRTVLELYSCPHALFFTYTLMDGGQSQMFPLEHQRCDKQQRRHPDQQEERRSRKKTIDFTVFEDAYSAVVSWEQKKK